MSVKDVDEIVKKAKNKKLQLMLKSVWQFNSNYEISDSQEELLKDVLEAMAAIDRKYFVNHNQAYADTALPIGNMQTISQPSTVARMIVLADLEKSDRVLEIGTGSGWNAALISYLVCGERKQKDKQEGRVDSIERDSSLTEKARDNINKMKRHLSGQRKECLKSIKLMSGNVFRRELSEKYDKIIFTAGIDKGKEEKVEDVAKRLLGGGGKLICPYRSGPLLIYDKKDGKVNKKNTKEMYNFVPLIE